MNEAIVISASYNKLDKDERRGVLDYEQLDHKRTRILYQALALVDSVEQVLTLQVGA